MSDQHYPEDFLELIKICDKEKIFSKRTYEKKYRDLKEKYPGSFIPSDLKVFRNKKCNYHVLTQKKLRENEKIDPLSYVESYFVSHDIYLYIYPNGRRVRFKRRFANFYKAHVTEVLEVFEQLGIKNKRDYLRRKIDIEYILDKYVPQDYESVIIYKKYKDDKDRRTFLTFEELKDLLKKEKIHSPQEYILKKDKLKKKYPYHFYYHWHKTICDYDSEKHFRRDLFN